MSVILYSAAELLGAIHDMERRTVMHCDDPHCPGWKPCGEPHAVEKCDECGRFDSDLAAEIHVREYITKLTNEMIGEPVQP